jgi:hypothetical protein
MAISPLASVSDLPCSMVSSSASGCWLSMMASCSLRSSLWRSSTLVFFHDRNAASAASMARRVSALPEFGTVPMTRPVAGLVTSTVLPESACTHSPPMKLAWRMKWLVFWSMMVSLRSRPGGTLCVT